MHFRYTRTFPPSLTISRRVACLQQETVSRTPIYNIWYICSLCPFQLYLQAPSFFSTLFFATTGTALQIDWDYINVCAERRPHVDPLIVSSKFTLARSWIVQELTSFKRYNYSVISAKHHSLFRVQNAILDHAGPAIDEARITTCF